MVHRSFEYSPKVFICVNIVVEFYSWFNFDFSLFFSMLMQYSIWFTGLLYMVILYMVINIKQRKIKIKPRIKLN